MKNKIYKIKWETIVLLLLILLNFTYFFWLEGLIKALFAGTAPSWFENLVSNLYPRLIVERSRFNPNFFLEKAFQIVLRGDSVVIGFLLFSIALKYSETFRGNVNTFWSEKESGNYLASLVAIFQLGLLILLYDWAEPLYDFLPLTEFYEPILLFKILHISFPNQFWLSVWVVLFASSAILLIAYFGFGKLKKMRNYLMLISISNSLIFILLHGYYLCFGKVVHTYSPIIYVSLLMPILIWEVLKSNQRKSKDILLVQPSRLGKPPLEPKQEKQVSRLTTKTFTNFFILKLIQIAIASCYFLSGLDKLFTSGFAWLNPTHFKLQLLESEQALGLWLLESADWLISLAPTLAILFQLGFISIIFFPKLRCIFLPAGFLFHLGTFLLLGVGWWLHPWLLGYVFFVRWRE
ncbi:MAG: hypothetical protein ACI85I_002909 [Arenicella sp.]|jgi:hypothetical protein